MGPASRKKVTREGVSLTVLACPDLFSSYCNSALLPVHRDVTAVPVLLAKVD